MTGWGLSGGRVGLAGQMCPTGALRDRHGQPERGLRPQHVDLDERDLFSRVRVSHESWLLVAIERIRHSAFSRSGDVAAAEPVDSETRHRHSDVLGFALTRDGRGQLRRGASAVGGLPRQPRADGSARRDGRRAGRAVGPEAKLASWNRTCYPPGPMPGRRRVIGWPVWSRSLPASCSIPIGLPDNAHKSRTATA